jgi:hypothetical protein
MSVRYNTYQGGKTGHICLVIMTCNHTETEAAHSFSLPRCISYCGDKKAHDDPSVLLIFSDTWTSINRRTLPPFLLQTPHFLTCFVSLAVLYMFTCNKKCAAEKLFPIKIPYKGGLLMFSFNWKTCPLCAPIWHQLHGLETRYKTVCTLCVSNVSNVGVVAVCVPIVSVKPIM